MVDLFYYRNVEDLLKQEAVEEEEEDKGEEKEDNK